MNGISENSSQEDVITFLTSFAEQNGINDPIKNQFVQELSMSGINFSHSFKISTA